MTPDTSAWSQDGRTASATGSAARYAEHGFAGRGASAGVPITETVREILEHVSMRLPVHQADLGALASWEERTRRRSRPDRATAAAESGRELPS